MENTKKFNLSPLARTLMFSSLLAIAPSSFAVEDEDPEKEPQTQTEEKKIVELDIENIDELKEELKEEFKRHNRFKRITLSDDKETYTIDGREEEGEKPVDGERFYVKYRKKKDRNVEYRVKKLNDRDGFYLAYSALSSTGDDIYQPDEKSETSFDAHFSYRIQLLGLFVESPGLNSRRLHGLYASNAWGINFYNSDSWSFDLYKQFDTHKVEGLEQVQNRNQDRRGGLRATGYFDNSQLQFIFSPYSRGDQEDDGVEASVSYTHYWQIKNWNIYGSLGAQYQSAEVLSFEQDPIDEAQSRVNTSAELGLEYALNKDWVIGAFASYNELPSQDANDDITVTGSRAGMSLSFIF